MIVTMCQCCAREVPSSQIVTVINAKLRRSVSIGDEVAFIFERKPLIKASEYCEGCWNFAYQHL